MKMKEIGPRGDNPTPGSADVRSTKRNICYTFFKIFDSIVVSPEYWVCPTTALDLKVAI